MVYTVRVWMIVILSWLGLLLIEPILAQNLPERLNTFLQKQAPDKINLVTNKTSYLAGDTVFFRVSTFQQAADNLIEVQLLTPETHQNKTTKVLLKGGYQVSYLTLPTESISGDYIIRAFSSSGWESSASISVFNLSQKLAEYQASDWIQPDLGTKLAVTKKTSSIEMSWNTNKKFSNPKGWLLITGSNQVSYSQEIDLNAINRSITVPLNAFSTRQGQIILAIGTGEIIGHFDYGSSETGNDSLQLELNKSIYATREPVVLKINKGFNSTKLENSILAVRVLEQTDSINEIENSKDLQTGDLYLNKSLPVINLKKILNNPLSPDDYIFSLKGKLVTSPDNKPVANSLIHLLVPATNQIEVLYSDKEGRIQGELDIFEGKKPIIFRAIQEGNEIKNISFIPDSAQSLMSWQPSYTPQSYSPTQKKIMERLTTLRRINQAFYPAIAYENNNLRGLLKPTAFQENKLKPTTNYDLLKYEQFSNVTEIFRELIPAVEVVKRKDGMRARLYARLLKKFYNYYPLFLIDGIPTYDVETILNIPANQLAKIDVFNTSTALAPFDVISTGGVIALYTKDRNFNPTVLHDNIQEYSGTAPAYIFPNVKSSEPTSPDFNSLIYWNPQVKLNDTGSTNLIFQTNDQSGKFIIEVSIVTDQGEIIRSTKIFTVEPEK